MPRPLLCGIQPNAHGADEAQTGDAGDGKATGFFYMRFVCRILMARRLEAVECGRQRTRTVVVKVASGLVVVAMYDLVVAGRSVGQSVSLDKGAGSK